MKSLNIVAVPFHDWRKCQAEGFRTRDAHLLQEFMRHPQVNRLLVVDRPLSVSEMLLLRRPLKVKGIDLEYQRGLSNLTKINENTFVLDILILQFLQPIIQRQKWIPGVFGQMSIKNAVQNAVKYLEMENYVLFLSSPLPIPLYNQLNPRLLVIDAVDNFTKHSTFKYMRQEIAAYYQVIEQNADLIFANSIETAEWLGHDREDTFYIPNGVDFLHFGKATGNIPSDLSRIKKPIVGYAGKMQEMFDTDLLRNVAITLPEVSFVCIGQILDRPWMKGLWDLPNVHYLGDKHYDILPDYLNGFDICMIPYSIERQHGGDPIKFYEYLAMNKPVITTNIGGVTSFDGLPIVKITNSVYEFVEAVKYYLIAIKNEELFSKVELPQDVLWSSKADEMIKKMVEKLSLPEPINRYNG